MAAAQQGERRRRRAEHRDPGLLRRARAPARAQTLSTAAGSGPETISAASRPKGGMPAARALGQLGGEEAVAVAGDQRLHHRMLRHVGLEQRPARPLGAAGAAGDLMEQLEGPLGGAQIAAVQAEIGIDHADQGQVGKVMALGDDLGADQDVDLARDPCARRRRVGLVAVRSGCPR